MDATVRIYKILRLVGHQHWIRVGIRDRIIRKYCNPDTLGPIEFEADYFGLKYHGTLNNYLDWTIYYYGAYERGYLFLLRDIIEWNKGKIFIDVGANVGSHSLFMSKYCKEVHAFEPYNHARKKLEYNIAINSLRNVTVHDLGLGAEGGRMNFYYPKGCNQGTGSLVEEHSRSNTERCVIDVANGDKYLSKLELGSIDLIKIDVEGFEKYVLMGLKNIMDTYRPIITMEWSLCTKNSFVGLNAIFELLPREYSILEVTYDNPVFKIFNHSGYKIGRFDFNVPGRDLLICPKGVLWM